MGAPLVGRAQAVPLPRPPADTGKTKSKPDSAKVDSFTFKAAPGLAKKDSITKDSIAKDTIKAPLARAFAPANLEIAQRSWHWDRDSIFASGALTLGDLLSVVPGVTTLTAGFLMAPQVAALNGDPSATKLYLDGVELDQIQPRNGGIADLAFIPLWTLEDITVERTAGQLRVHMRTWRVDNTTPQTRVDVLSGSDNMNVFRGWYGRRFDNGLAIQFSGQQYSTVSSTNPYGDNLGIMSRIGWARGSWSVDAMTVRQTINRQKGPRGLLFGPATSDGVPAFKGNEGTAYARIAWRDPAQDGPWLQVIAASIRAAEDHATSSTGTTVASVPGDSVDTLRTRSEYTITGGISRGALRLSGTTRVRSVDHHTFFSSGARAEYANRFVAVGAVAEQALDLTKYTDITARVTPRSWLNIGAAASRASPGDSALGPAYSSARLEAAFKFRDRWISGGIVTRSAQRMLPLIEMDTSLRRFTVPAATGVTVGFRGPVWRGWEIDIDGTSWQDGAPYRPQQQLRSRLWFQSWFLERFPRKNFHLAVELTNDYRTAAYLPAAGNLFGQASRGGNIWGSNVEIRISSAVISWQYRNMAGYQYESVPGYLMPRLLNIYGVRWEFWN